jgi:hypothetical protein
MPSPIHTALGSDTKPRVHRVDPIRTEDSWGRSEGAPAPGRSLRYAFETAPQQTAWADMLAVWREADQIDALDSLVKSKANAVTTTTTTISDASIDHALRSADPNPAGRCRPRCRCAQRREIAPPTAPPGTPRAAVLSRREPARGGHRSRGRRPEHPGLEPFPSRQEQPDHDGKQNEDQHHVLPSRTARRHPRAVPWGAAGFRVQGVGDPLEAHHPSRTSAAPRRIGRLGSLVPGGFLSTGGEPAPDGRLAAGERPRGPRASPLAAARLRGRCRGASARVWLCRSAAEGRRWVRSQRSAAEWPSGLRIEAAPTPTSARRCSSAAPPRRGTGGS